MHIKNLAPFAAQPLANGSALLARFEVELSADLTARLALVRSGRDGTDLILSASGPDGPVLHLSPPLKKEIAKLVRAEIASLAAALQAA